MKELNRQDLYDILYGCTILGTGGGGGLQEGLDLIDKALEKGKKFKLVSFDEVDDEALIGTPYMCGAISPETEEERKKYADFPRIEDHSALKAIEALEDYFEESLYGVVSTELGGGNTAVAFYAGAMLDKYIIDADPAGRSVPELQHSTYFVNGLPIYPFSVATDFGDVAIFKEVVNDFRAEALVRALAVVSKNKVSVVDHPGRAKDLKNVLINGAISYALEIGKAYRLAKEQNMDIALKVSEAGQGIMRFKGQVKDFKYKTEDGFTVGEVIIEGSGEYAGNTYKTWFKNEHIFSWLNDEIDVTVPDLICIINEDSKEPVTNPNYEKGMKVAVFALPAPKEWTTPIGLEVFGPRSFGKNIDYIPIQKKFK